MPAARVDGTTITRAALAAAMIRAAPASGDAPGPIQDPKLRAATLDRLILVELAYQRAARAGLQAASADVDAALASLREQLGGEDAYRAHLAARGVREDEFRREVARDLAVERLYAREVTAKVVVTESALREAYQAQSPRFAKPEKIHLVDVVVYSTPQGTSARTRAAAILERIRSDPNQDPWQLALDGTFLVRNYEPRLPRDEALVREARRIGAGGLSEVIEGADGAHVFKVREYQPAGAATFEEARPFLERELRPEAIRRRVREWEEELRKGAVIEILPQS